MENAQQSPVIYVPSEAFTTLVFARDGQMTARKRFVRQDDRRNTRLVAACPFARPFEHRSATDSLAGRLAGELARRWLLLLGRLRLTTAAASMFMLEAFDRRGRRNFRPTARRILTLSKTAPEWAGKDGENQR